MTACFCIDAFDVRGRITSANPFTCASFEYLIVLAVLGHLREDVVGLAVEDAVHLGECIGQRRDDTALMIGMPPATLAS